MIETIRTAMAADAEALKAVLPQADQLAPEELMALLTDRSLKKSQRKLLAAATVPDITSYEPVYRDAVREYSIAPYFTELWLRHDEAWAMERLHKVLGDDPEHAIAALNAVSTHMPRLGLRLFRTKVMNNLRLVTDDMRRAIDAWFSAEIPNRPESQSVRLDSPKVSPLKRDDRPIHIEEEAAPELAEGEPFEPRGPTVRTPENIARIWWSEDKADYYRIPKGIDLSVGELLLKSGKHELRVDPESVERFAITEEDARALMAEPAEAIYGMARQLFGAFRSQVSGKTDNPMPEHLSDALGMEVGDMVKGDKEQVTEQLAERGKEIGKALTDELRATLERPEIKNAVLDALKGFAKDRNR